MIDLNDVLYPEYDAWREGHYEDWRFAPDYYDWLESELVKARARCERLRAVAKVADNAVVGDMIGTLNDGDMADIRDAIEDLLPGDLEAEG